MLGYAARRVGRQDAEDVTQGALARAWRAWRPGIENPRAWVFTILDRHIANTLRTAYRHNESPGIEGVTLTAEDPLDAEGRAERAALLAEVVAGIRALPDSQRQALLSAAGLAPARDEAADGGARMLVYRARRSLTNHLARAGWTG